MLNASGTGLATAEDLVARHPGLTDSKYPRGRVTAKLLETAQNLARWEARIASGPPTKVKDGEFWLGEDGTILRAQRTAKRADITVPADVYREEPGVGRIAPTGETRLLRALRVGGTKCHVATLLASDDEDDSGGEDDSMGEEEEVGYRGGGAPRDLADAINREYRHVHSRDGPHARLKDASMGAPRDSRRGEAGGPQRSEDEGRPGHVRGTGMGEPQSVRHRWAVCIHGRGAVSGGETEAHPKHSGGYAPPIDTAAGGTPPVRHNAPRALARWAEMQRRPGPVRAMPEDRHAR